MSRGNNGHWCGIKLILTTIRRFDNIVMRAKTLLQQCFDQSCNNVAEIVLTRDGSLIQSSF